METSDNRLVSMGAGFGDGAGEGRRGGTLASCFSTSAVGRVRVGDSSLDCSARCDSGAVTPPSSLGALGTMAKERSRSSLENSRFVGTIGPRLVISPGLTHWLLFGAPIPKGTLEGAKGGRSGGACTGGRATIRLVLSAFGPVGMLMGALFGEVLIDIGFRGPIGIAVGEASLAVKGTCAGLENDGDTLDRSTACGPVGGGRPRAAGPKGGE